MSRDIPITLTPAEQQAHQNGTLRVLIRAAEKCRSCGGDGSETHYDEGAEMPYQVPCELCNSTGYTNPLGNKGDVLVAEIIAPERNEYGEEWVLETIRLPRKGEGRLCQADEHIRELCQANGVSLNTSEWVYVGGVE